MMVSILFPDQGAIITVTNLILDREYIESLYTKALYIKELA